MTQSLVSELTTLWTVVDRLTAARIPYLLTGSLALNFYGHVRATNDIDLVVQIAPTAAKRVYDLFKNDFYISLEAMQDAIQQRAMFNIIDNASIFKVDLIIARDDAVTEQQFQRRRCLTLGERQIYVIAPEDLILAKLDWSRDSQSQLQENDIKNILRSCAAELDATYLRQWADTLRVRERLEQLYADL